jgi:signal transduction histidine kinase
MHRVNTSPAGRLRLATACSCLIGLLGLPGTRADFETPDDEPPIVSRPKGPRPAKSEYEWDPAKWRVGSYIWSATTTNKQTCQLWKRFEIPPGATVTAAALRVLADNSFVVYLDGRELGMGSDYYYMTEYNVGEVLAPGPHVIAIRAFNESYQAGVVAGLRARLAKGSAIVVLSDDSWRVVPEEERGWERRLEPQPNWEFATVVAPFGGTPWIDPPLQINKVLVHPLEQPAFWKQVWFQSLVVAVGGAAALASLLLATRLVAESRARQLLDRERARIARDIHDELGAGLTQLVLEGEVARTELPAGSAAGDRLESLCDRARTLAVAMDELVWAVNSRRDTLRDLVTYASKYVRRFLEPTPIRCRFDIAPDLPDVTCDLPVRRNVLLAVKEAVNNAVKHSGSQQLCFRIERRPPLLVVTVEDEGRGFDLKKSGATGNGLNNLAERMRDIGGTCRIVTAPGAGCRVELEVPLARFARRAAPPDVVVDLLGMSGGQEPRSLLALPPEGQSS